MVPLYYGPTAQDAALAAALSAGSPVHEPLGTQGLKTDEARLAVALLSRAPIGDRKGVLVLGPLDLANEKASDVLLKKIEEPTSVLPILWAHDLEGVRPTIRSRSAPNWCPGELSFSDEDLDLSSKLLDNILSKNWSDVYRDLRSIKGELLPILRVLTNRLPGRMQEDPAFMTRLWVGLRQEMTYRRLSWLGVWSAILEADNG